MFVYPGKPRRISRLVFLSRKRCCRFPQPSKSAGEFLPNLDRNAGTCGLRLFDKRSRNKQKNSRVHCEEQSLRIFPATADGRGRWNALPPGHVGVVVSRGSLRVRGALAARPSIGGEGWRPLACYRLPARPAAARRAWCASGQVFAHPTPLLSFPSVLPRGVLLTMISVVVS